jgi:spermidine/putrescine-binding protein
MARRLVVTSTPMRRRHFLRTGLTGGAFLIGGGASALLAACQARTAEDVAGGKVEGEVRFLTWEAFDDPSFTADFESEFAPVNATYFGSFDEMFGKIKSGGGNAYDIVMTASDVVLPLVDAGDLAPFDESKLTNYGNLREQFQHSPQHMKDGELYAVPADWGSTVLLVDTNELGEQPTVLPYDMLFDPELRGRVATMDDQAVLWTTAVYLGHNEFWDLSDEQLDDIQAFLIDKLVPNVRKFATTFADEANLFANQEVALAWGWTGVIRAELAAVGADHVTEHNIEPSMPWYVDTYSLVADSPNIEAAHAWVNYNLRPDVSGQRFSALGLPAVVPEAAEHMSPEEASLSYLDQPEFWESLDVTLEWKPIRRRDRYQEVWNSVKAGAQ